jgi:NodT family efflux transporter outer membrane factor (OMF) lipoprotein
MPHPCRAIPVLCAAATLAGCTVGPDYKEPESPVPPAWAGLDGANVTSPPNAEQPDVATWWTQFNDPVLISLIERADAGNLTLAQAQARVRQARAARTIAASGLYPSVDASAAATRARSNIVGTGPSTTNLFRAGFDATWEIDVFGGTRRGVEAANAQIESAYFDRQTTLVSINAEVADAYFTLRGAQRELAVARENLAAQQQTLDLTQERFDAGFVTTLDVANAKAQVGQTASQIPAYDAVVHTSAYAIGVLLGQEPAALLAELTPDQPLPRIPAQVPVGLPSDLLRRRPDIRKADADLHVATANIGVAVADQYPKFSLTGSFGTQGGTVASLGTVANRFWSIGPAVSLPLFTGGRIQGNIEQARAIADQSVLAYRTTVLTALQDVETALVNFTREQQRREALAQSAAASQQAVAVALDLYSAGRTDFLNVLSAQGQLYVTQTALTQSETAVGTDLVSLYKALGGGWVVTDSSADDPTAQ